MHDGFNTRIDAIAADALYERASAFGHSIEEEVDALRREAQPLSIADKVALSARQRAMAPTDCLSDDSTLIIRWYRDTNGGRDTDDGWIDDHRR
ncbi:hypothetical protein M9979_15900 [Sphingomonas sp. RP10(2022)]|uniref:Uncharacterized protein n=1 Tax=Sphingomonas liriopis TaxID=2949094 RepID=A0A9X2HRW6_9SPHN|nr:hypothetical protein [Sphingomonas liriopis]MCP3736351.1 hypothetical protein [Sphingomonas liriopis]